MQIVQLWIPGGKNRFCISPIQDAVLLNLFQEHGLLLKRYGALRDGTSSPIACSCVVTGDGASYDLLRFDVVMSTDGRVLARIAG